MMNCPNCDKQLKWFGFFKEGSLFGCARCDIEVCVRQATKGDKS